MKNILITIILFIPFFLTAQPHSEFSLGFSTGFSTNFNKPVNFNNIDKITVRNYQPGFNLGLVMLYNKNKYQLVFNSFYNYSRYGWKLLYEISGFRNFDRYWQVVNNYSTGLQLNIFHKYFYRHNARLYSFYGIEYCQRSFGTKKFHYTTEYSSESEIIGVNRYFSSQDWELIIQSVQYSIGLKIATQLKKAGKIDYGIAYYFQPKPLPETWLEYTYILADHTTGNLREQIIKAGFETQQSFVNLFITFYLFNWGKLNKQTKIKRIKYKV